VIVGRCANFILPPEKTLRVRIIAPLPIRIQTIAKRLGISEAEAKKQVLKTDSDRRAFSRKYFYADLTDPFHYDLLINTGRMHLDTAVAAVGAMAREWKQA
jgi:cytidylate kinase